MGKAIVTGVGLILGWMAAGAVGAMLGLMAAACCLLGRELFWRFVDELASCSVHRSRGEPELSAPQPVAEPAPQLEDAAAAFDQRASAAA